MRVHEQPLLLDGGRVGVLALPASADQEVGVVLLNAGAIHRAGPSRLHVTLARRLAAAGYPVLRIDQPGVGDAVASASRPQLDLAMDMLDRFGREGGCSRFVVGGICSAADFGWKLALRDPRVAGLLLLDPLARQQHPAFQRGKWQLHWQRGPRSWIGTLARRLRPAAGTQSAVRPADSELRDWPRPGEEAAQLQQLVDRGVELFVLYTGGAAAYFLHPLQFLDGFGNAARSARVSFRYWRDCDHVFFLPEHRERLQETFCEWMGQRFPAASSRTRAAAPPHY